MSRIMLKPNDMLVAPRKTIFVHLLIAVTFAWHHAASAAA
jgi:hypothetical protein